MANERARQQKLERKHRKREEKRRALRAVGPSLSVPRAMSLTLKEFAQPLLERLPDEADPEDWKVVLTFAAMVWNAESDALPEKVLTLGRELFQALGWEGDVDEELRRLRARKAAEFAWEPRLVAGVEVERRGDMMHVLAASVLA